MALWLILPLVDSVLKKFRCSIWLLFITHRRRVFGSGIFTSNVRKGKIINSYSMSLLLSYLLQISVLTHFDWSWNRFLDRTTFDRTVITYGLPPAFYRPVLPPSLAMADDLSQRVTEAPLPYARLRSVLNSFKSRFTALFSSS